MDPEAIQNSMQVVRGSEVHGLALGLVKLDPTGTIQSINNNDVHVLPMEEELNLTVTVENQGNRSESGLLVTVVLYSETDPTPQRMESEIEDLAAEAKVDVSFRGLQPTTGGARNILEVKVNPVAGEAMTENNSKVIYFIMK
jgi:hypothetical protein